MDPRAQGIVDGKRQRLGICFNKMKSALFGTKAAVIGAAVGEKKPQMAFSSYIYANTSVVYKYIYSLMTQY